MSPKCEVVAPILAKALPTILKHASFSFCSSLSFFFQFSSSAWSYECWIMLWFTTDGSFRESLGWTRESLGFTSLVNQLSWWNLVGCSHSVEEVCISESSAVEVNITLSCLVLIVQSLFTAASLERPRGCSAVQCSAVQCGETDRPGSPGDHFNVLIVKMQWFQVNRGKCPLCDMAGWLSRLLYSRSDTGVGRNLNHTQIITGMTQGNFWTENWQTWQVIRIFADFHPMQSKFDYPMQSNAL